MEKHDKFNTYQLKEIRPKTNNSTVKTNDYTKNISKSLSNNFSKEFSKNLGKSIGTGIGSGFRMVDTALDGAVYTMWFIIGLVTNGICVCCCAIPWTIAYCSIRDLVPKQ